MSDDTSSVHDLLDLNGEKMCTHDGCRHHEFLFVDTFGPLYTFMCDHCGHNYRKDCDCTGSFCEHTPMESQCVNL